MSCFEVNRIETALGEIEALNILRAQEKPPSFFPSRRPYLSRNQREVVAKLSQTSLERQLPGRKAEDVLNFLNDYQMDSVEESYLSFGSRMDRKHCPSVSFTRHESSMLFFPRFVKQFSVTSLNSAVNAIAVRQGFRGNGRVFVGCCTLNALEYNGPELLMISHVNNRFSAHLLDGHRTFVRRANEFRRDTVTSVAYDQATDTFITGGYDGRVLSWGAESGTMLSEIASQGSTVNSVTTHPEEDILAFGVSLGAVFIASKPTKLKPESKIHCLFKKPATTNPDKNTVDWVSIPQCGDRTNSLFVGIGHLASAKGGVVEEWDLKANRLVANSRPIENGLSCMQVSSDGKLLAAGSGCIVKNDKGDGLIRVFDLANGLRGGINIVTGMHDMEAVSFCPRTKFLFATDSFTSNWSVYDLRFTKEPIFTSTHFMLQSGEVQQNEVVSHCWLKGGDFIATGGHDETLKIWDCNGSFALVDSFTFKSGISQIEYFADDDALIVGTDSGEVAWLSPSSYVDANHPRELESILTY